MGVWVRYSFKIREMLFLSTSSFFIRDELSPVIVVDDYFDDGEEYVRVVDRVMGQLIEISDSSKAWKQNHKNHSDQTKKTFDEFGKSTRLIQKQCECTVLKIDTGDADISAVITYEIGL